MVLIRKNSKFELRLIRLSRQQNYFYPNTTLKGLTGSQDYQDQGGDERQHPP